MMRTISIALVLVCAIGSVAACSSGASNPGHGHVTGESPTSAVRSAAAGSTPPSAGVGQGSTRSGRSSANVCEVVKQEVAERVLGAPVQDLSVTADACLLSGRRGNRLELLRLPADTVNTALAAGSFTRLSGVGDRAYWSSDDQLLIVVAGDNAYSVNVSVDANSEAANQAAAITVANAAIGA